jgi:hypothetical protein
VRKNKQQHKSIFIVSSAIHSKHGVYDTNQRLNQTIETFKSIKKHTNADIIVLDGGYKNLNAEEQEQIKGYIKTFYSFADIEEIKQIQKSTNWDIVKNLIELIMFGSFFNSQAIDVLKNYNRVFKLSGRYTLNENFDYKKHMNAKEKILIRGPYTSQFSSEITGGVSTQYMSRLWSFDASLLPEITLTYTKMYKHMMTRLQEGGYIDIEHLLQAHLPNQNVELVSKIGVQGNIAPNGVAISD